MAADQSKLAKHGIPWAAVVVAVLGWYDAREESKAVKERVVDQQVDIMNTREETERSGRKSWAWVQAQFDMQRQQLEDLNAWVDELEGFIEKHIEEDSPRTRRERRERNARLSEIRRKKRERRHKPKPAAKLPDYDVAQRSAAPDVGK